MAREERAAYVEQACGDDTALRAAVADVLQGADAATFLESPALEFAAPMAVTPRGFTAAHFSPDGRQIATAVVPTDGGQSDIWVLDLARNTFRRVTFDSGSVSPVWSPNGQRIAFGTKPGGRQFGYSIRWVLADGGDSAETLLAGELAQFPDTFTPDGRALVFQRRDLVTGRDIRILPLAMDRVPQPFLRTPFDERGAAVSPDGRWLAYVSDESGRDEV